MLSSNLLTSMARYLARVLLSFIACWLLGRFYALCLVSILASTPLALMVLSSCFDRLFFDTHFDAAQFHDPKACLSASILRCFDPWSLRRSIPVFDVGVNTARFVACLDPWWLP